MRIAQVAPLGESVPPPKYGGTERIVSYLTEALVEAGHEVTLYGAAGSQTAAKFQCCFPCTLRQLPGQPDLDLIYRHVMAEVRAHARNFDVVHFHTGWFEFAPFAQSPVPRLTTMHGRLNIPELQQRLRPHPYFPLISISDSQRSPMPDLNWVSTIYHGIPTPWAPPVAPASQRSYLTFLGRISPEKRPDTAIEIAQKAGLPLKIAAKVDPVDQEYFDTLIRPMLDLPGVEYLGELDDYEKGRLLAGSSALLFPIDWPEPFGLAMIEAMACGTPVIAFRRGSVPEVIDAGITGFIVEDVDGAVAALDRVPSLDAHTIRATFDARFSITRMVDDYVAIYDRLIAQNAEWPEASYGRPA